MKTCPKCHGKIKQRISDFARMGLAEPGFMKRNKVWECQGKCGELWYEGKTDVINDRT